MHRYEIWIVRIFGVDFGRTTLSKVLVSNVTRKVIFASSAPFGAPNRRWGFESLVRKPMRPGQDIRLVRLCAFGRDRKATGDFYELLDLRR